MFNVLPICYIFPSANWLSCCNIWRYVAATMLNVSIKSFSNDRQDVLGVTSIRRIKTRTTFV